MQKAHDAQYNNYWENYPSVATPIIAAQLNRNEQTVDEIDDRVVAMDTTKASQVDMLQAVKSIAYDGATGVFTITFFNNTSTTIDTDLEKLAINFDYDDNPSSPNYQKIIIELDDGTYKYIDLSALITEYEFNSSSTIAPTVSGSGSVSFDVIDGSITANKIQPNYLADVTAQANIASNASSSATGSADDAEAWANGTRGGVPVSQTDPAWNNNSLYWKNQAQAIAGGGVITFNNRNGAVVPQFGDYEIGDITPPLTAQEGQIAVVNNLNRFEMGTVGQQKMTGYTEPASSSAIVATDTINQAIGKVERKADNLSDFNTFNIATTDWSANSDPNTSTDYPYICVKSSALYSNASTPVWQLNGTGSIPTQAEREGGIDLVPEAYFDTTGITLYATEQPTVAMVLEVKGV